MLEQLQDLERRLAEAEGADRELDAAIVVATTPTKNTGDDLIYLKTIRRDDDCAAGTYWYCSRSGRSLHTAPELTASLDASIHLVEEVLPGCLWSMNNRGMAHVWLEGQDFFCEPAGCFPKDDSEKSKPPALALLLALVRALIAQEQSDG